MYYANHDAGEENISARYIGPPYPNEFSLTAVVENDKLYAVSGMSDVLDGLLRLLQRLDGRRTASPPVKWIGTILGLYIRNIEAK